jgi:hypothetical protein
LFLTMPHNAQFTPVAAGDDQQWWRAVTLFAASHWFQFVHEVPEGAEKACRTAIVADEWTLLSLLADTPAEDRKSVCRLEREKGRHRWIARWVDTVWMPAPTEVEQTGVLLLQFEGESCIRDTYMRFLEPREGRTLLYKAAPAGQLAGLSSPSGTD